MMGVSKAMNDFHLMLKDEQRIILIESYKRRLHSWRKNNRKCLYPVTGLNGRFKGFIAATGLDEAQGLLGVDERLYYAPDGFIYPLMI
jgi:hypothetical protein